MKKALFLPIIALSCIFLITACRNDIREVVFNIPEMKSPKCAESIQKALMGMDGLISAIPDYAEKTMTVTYDSKKLAIMNIEYTITGQGFDTENSKAKEADKAKLPPECK